MKSKQEENSVYVLSHSENELDRLIEQARLFDDLTEQVFLSAGITRGMRVLDIGCGPGDISLLAARLVGPSGTVIGIDRSAESIAVARSRISAAKLQNVTFVENEITALSLDQSVDAVVGRCVLMYLPDPVAAVRVIADYIRRGGILAFREPDFTNPLPSFPKLPLCEHTVEWILETFRRGNVEMQMGLKLYQTFIRAGLSAPRMTMSARVEGGVDSPAYVYLAQTVRSLLPMMEELGITTAEEIEIETLADRLRDEVVHEGGVVVLPNLVGAWVHKPI